MKRKYTKADRDYLNRENLNYSEKLTVVTDVKLQNNTTNKILGVWRSRRFLVVLWQEENGNQRLSCQRTKMTVDGEWVDGITWDDLQRLKGEAGFGDRWAVEIFPPNYAVVNVANIRHLWLMTNPPGFGWHKSGPIATGRPVHSATRRPSSSGPHLDRTPTESTRLKGQAASLSLWWGRGLVWRIRT